MPMPSRMPSWAPVSFSPETGWMIVTAARQVGEIAEPPGGCRVSLGDSIEGAAARDEVALLRVLLDGPGECLDGLRGPVRKDEHLRRSAYACADVRVRAVDLDHRDRRRPHRRVSLRLLYVVEPRRACAPSRRSVVPASGFRRFHRWTPARRLGLARRLRRRADPGRCSATALAAGPGSSTARFFRLDPRAGGSSLREARRARARWSARSFRGSAAGWTSDSRS